MPLKLSLPRLVAPMLAGASKPFDSDEYLFEVKWDGIRALAYVEGDGYRLLSRHHRDLTAQFLELDGLVPASCSTANWPFSVTQRRTSAPFNPAVLSVTTFWSFVREFSSFWTSLAPLRFAV